MPALRKPDRAASDVHRAPQRDASINMAGLGALVDQQRESARLTEPVSAAQVIDYSFVEKVRKELGMGR